MRHVPIVYKCLFILAAFGLFAVAVTGYAAWGTRQVSREYTELQDSKTEAAFAVSRANRSMQALHAAIGDVMIASTEEANAEATKTVEAAKLNFETSMDKAATLYPASAASIGKLKLRGLTLLTAECGHALALGAKATDTADVLAELLPVRWTPRLGCFTGLEGADGAATVQPGVQAGGGPAG